MAQQIQLRRDTTENWEQTNPILALGEPALEIIAETTFKIKYGNGVDAWVDLPYFSSGVTQEQFSQLVSGIETAQSTANTAQSIASNAHSTATTAANAASAAQTTANTANTNANAAKLFAYLQLAGGTHTVNSITNNRHYHLAVNSILDIVNSGVSFGAVLIITAFSGTRIRLRGGSSGIYDAGIYTNAGVDEANYVDLVSATNIATMVLIKTANHQWAVVTKTGTWNKSTG